MRKRSEVVAVDPRQQPLYPAEQTKPPLVETDSIPNLVKALVADGFHVTAEEVSGWSPTTREDVRRWRGTMDLSKTPACLIPAFTANPAKFGSVSTTKSDALPSGCTVEDNVFFIKCSDCGMHQGALMAKRNPETHRLHCFRCAAPFDERLTPEFIDRSRERWREQRNGAKADVPSPQVKSDLPVTQQGQKDQICHECGQRLTITTLGVFYPCGHKPPAKPSPLKEPEPAKPTLGEKSKPQDGDGAPISIKQDFKAANPDRIAHMIRQDLKTIERQEMHPPTPVELTSIEDEYVTVVWGKELFAPKQFNNFEVGPFTYRTAILPDETPLQACERAHKLLSQFAEIEFKRKCSAFIEKLKYIVGQVA